MASFVRLYSPNIDKTKYMYMTIYMYFETEAWHYQQTCFALNSCVGFSPLHWLRLRRFLLLVVSTCINNTSTLVYYAVKNIRIYTDILCRGPHYAPRSSLFRRFTETNVCGTGCVKVWKTRHQISGDIPDIHLQCIYCWLLSEYNFCHPWPTVSKNRFPTSGSWPYSFFMYHHAPPDPEGRGTRGIARNFIWGGV